MGVWIGGVWNGHFPKSENIFQRPNFPGNSLKFRRKSDVCQISGSEIWKFRARKIAIPYPQPFHTPTRLPPKKYHLIRKVFRGDGAWFASPILRIWEGRGLSRGYPADRAAEVAVRTVRQWLDEAAKEEHMCMQKQAAAQGKIFNLRESTLATENLTRTFFCFLNFFPPNLHFHLHFFNCVRINSSLV